MQRADAGYTYNFRVNYVAFKDDESKTEAKTNSGHRVCPFLIRSSLLACTEHAQSPLFTHYVNTHSHTPKNNFAIKNGPEFSSTLYWKECTINI